MEDLELLRAYIHRGDDQSLVELVRRHIGWVHTSALRQVRDPHLAEDVAQAVFIALAQKAHSLAGSAVISAWLFKVTRYASAKALRTEARRRQHEQRAATMRSEVPASEEGPEWQELSPLLDELVGRLGQKHQHLILLRFYQQKSFAEVAEALGISEEAARKRSERAIEQLREGFVRRGVTVGAPAALAGVVGLGCQVSANAGLVSAATAGALAAGKGELAASVPLVIAKGAMTTMAWAKAGLAATIAGGVVLVGSAGLVVAARAAAPEPVVVQQAAVPKPRVTVSAPMPALQPTDGKGMQFSADADVQKLLPVIRENEDRYNDIEYAYRCENNNQELGQPGVPAVGPVKTRVTEINAIYQGPCRWVSLTETNLMPDGTTNTVKAVQAYDGQTTRATWNGKEGAAGQPPEANPMHPFRLVNFNGRLRLSATLEGGMAEIFRKAGMNGSMRVTRVPAKATCLGLECIVLKWEDDITFSGKSDRSRWLMMLCPERNYLPLHVERWKANDQGEEEVTLVKEVKELTEIAPGVFFPTKIESEWRGFAKTGRGIKEQMTLTNVHLKPNHPLERFAEVASATQPGR